ncbi:DNA-3-methyladenine glycosylase [Candidatus Dojkabacteria bacterium]|uniref:Putative 3-methyladenine DNA glycosylase n=1 Tax=Candidatus Dojkabacteria bacterium TaxID=2099670 RepID=A0A955L4D3_9BACT|nr:DNA-3-methyladenine glycosylase [Candidatus Dojkabacteria bacterium]
MTQKRLTRKFFTRDTITVAQELLGKLLVSNIDGYRASGIIVETEAYVEGDEAAHTSRGKTKANEAAFGEPGRTYIHTIHGKDCMDIVTEKEGKPGSVLIRALEPVEGIEIMQLRRSKKKLKDLLSGPAKLCQALAITKKSHYTLDLCNSNSEIYLTQYLEEVSIGTTNRIGISKATDKQYRFILEGNEYLSR